MVVGLAWEASAVGMFAFAAGLAAGRVAVAVVGHSFCKLLSAGTPAAPSGTAACLAQPPACTSASPRQVTVSIPEP